MPLDNPQEVFYWVNAQDEVLGKVSRKEAHSGSFKIHRATVVLVLNDKKQMLLQQRSLQKDTSPGKWTISCGGHVTFGSTYEQTANQELQEELGIHAPLEHVGNFLFSDSVEKEWVATYEATVKNTQEFHPDPTEVSRVKWVNLSELSSFINENPFSESAKILLHKTNYL